MTTRGYGPAFGPLARPTPKAETQTMDDRTQQLAAEVAALSERLAEYQAAVADATEMLGHSGDAPVDLVDALGQVEALLAGEDSFERNDLAGLAEKVRAALWDRDRARMLLAQTRAVCERRTAERDEALVVMRACVSARMQTAVAQVLGSPEERPGCVAVPEGPVADHLRSLTLARVDSANSDDEG